MNEQNEATARELHKISVTMERREARWRRVLGVFHS